MRLFNLTILSLAICILAGCDTERPTDYKFAEDSETNMKFDSSKIVHLTKDNFDDIVNQHDKVVLIDFWATWCGPCLRLTPTIEQLSYEYDGLVTVCKVNVDEEKELADQFKISSIPAVFIVKNGQTVGQPIIGMKPFTSYAVRLDNALDE